MLAILCTWTVSYANTCFLLLFLPGPDGQECLLVTIPDFNSTQTACLVNLRTLTCEPISFSAFSADEDEDSEMNVSHWVSIIFTYRSTLLGRYWWTLKLNSYDHSGVTATLRHELQRRGCLWNTDAVQCHNGQQIAVKVTVVKVCYFSRRDKGPATS